MNSNAQAQKGFKTFILTLVISLAIFSAIYYIINSGTSENSLDEKNSNTVSSTNTGQLKAEAAPTNNTNENTVDDGKPTVFGAILNEKVDVPQRGVLAGATTGDTTTQVTSATTYETTVPVTGISGPTSGIIISSIIFGFAFYLIFLGPRKIALDSFEKKVIKDLD